MNKELLKLAWNQVKGRQLLDGDVRDEILSFLGDTLNLASPGSPLVPIAPLPAKGTAQRIALCLGHGRSGDEGVISVDGTSEEDFNLVLIKRIASVLKDWGHDVIVVSYYEGNGYTAAMRWLAQKLLSLKATAAIEFHFNAATGKARGHEFLHWKNSVRGVTLAKALLATFDRAFPEHPSRGAKALDAADRGALFLSFTHCPATIAEPFFGDNAEEWRTFGSPEGINRLVTAYSHGIAAWVESQAA